MAKLHLHVLASYCKCYDKYDTVAGGTFVGQPSKCSFASEKYQKIKHFVVILVATSLEFMGFSTPPQFTSQN